MTIAVHDGHVGGGMTVSEIPRVCDVLEPSYGQREAIDLRIEITLTHLDPPEGRAVRTLPPGDERTAEPVEFVGWLGLFWVLQSLAFEPVDQPLR
jgi:hypothetical protein